MICGVRCQLPLSLNEQLAELFDASVTLKIFVVVPVEKLPPLERPAV